MPNSAEALPSDLAAAHAMILAERAARLTAEAERDQSRSFASQTDALVAHLRRLEGATGATSALDRQADIAKVQEWLGHANMSTTRIYDHRRTRPEDNPTFKFSY